MAESIRDKSERMAAAVDEGHPVSKVMGGDYETMLDNHGAGARAHG